MPKVSKDELDQIREACEEDLYTFAQVVEPHRVYGDIHKELFNWMGRKDRKDNQLVLLPRDHQKSHMAAVYAAWRITQDPSTTIMYISATATLAEAQLYDIKNILTSRVYTTLWPDMLDPDEGKREKWSATQISVDHPKRKEEGVRDPTVNALGLTSNFTGLHCRELIKDDVVVPDNAYTEEGRRKVEAACSQLASVLTVGGRETAVGTRYHPKDHYGTVKEIKEDIFDDNWEVIDQQPVYELFERKVEDNGEFLWPKQMREDGKWFGFDWKELARKKAKYTDRTQFFAQYYNDPNDPELARLSRDRFQYYNRKFLEEKNGQWMYNGRKLNVYSAIDFAFSTKTKADWTALVVVGVDYEGYIYVLDIDRFKTNKMENYFQAVFNSYQKWGYRKLRAEVTVAQKTIAEYLKDRARQLGMALSIDEHRPNRHQGSKEERIASILEPRYDNLSIYHYKGGMCSALEEELLLPNPAHDDIKDALAACVEVAKAPKTKGKENQNVSYLQYHPRFGGVSYS